MYIIVNLSYESQFEAGLSISLHIHLPLTFQYVIFYIVVLSPLVIFKHGKIIFLHVVFIILKTDQGVSSAGSLSFSQSVFFICLCSRDEQPALLHFGRGSLDG